MAKLEKYGLGLKGLRAACTRTKNCRPYFGGYGVYYDRRKDEVLTTYYRNEDTYRCNKYSDKDIINICYTTEPMTMQSIADAIHSCTELTSTGVTPTPFPTPTGILSIVFYWSTARTVRLTTHTTPLITFGLSLGITS